MQNLSFLLSRLSFVVVLLFAYQAEADSNLKAQPAEPSTSATRASLIGAATVGKHIVAVGDYGITLLSDDDGKHFHQAAAVPVSSTLTAVALVDEKIGWAVGHWGVILNTLDGGEHWTLQRMDTQVDRPLFSVHFFDAQQGIAAGLWSLLLSTVDGGKSWNPLSLPAPPDGGKSDCNLFKIFVSAKGTLFVAAERGLVLRSADRGKTWQYVATGYKGSFWSGLGLKSGVLLVAGLRGTIYRSTDDGLSWLPVNSGVKSSITDLAQYGDKLLAVGLDGLQLTSLDEGATFTAVQREDRLSINTLAGTVAPVLFSQKGVVPEDKK